MEADVVVFSKNRPAQLDLLIRSMWAYLPVGMGNVSVLYKADDGYADSYEIIKKTYPGISYYRETPESSFPYLLHSILARAGSNYVMFLVDDDVFVRNPDFSSKGFLRFMKDDEVFTFSTRMHPGITRCYVRDTVVTPPEFKSGELVWEWRSFGQENDWGWVSSVDGNIYKKQDAIRFVTAGGYSNPNSFEWAILRWASARSRLKYAACSALPSVVNIPMNVVQDDQAESRNCGIGEDVLERMFTQGRRLSLDRIAGCIGDAPHIEYELHISGE